MARIVEFLYLIKNNHNMNLIKNYIFMNKIMN